MGDEGSGLPWPVAVVVRGEERSFQMVRLLVCFLFMGSVHDHVASEFKWTWDKLCSVATATVIADYVPHERVESLCPLSQGPRRMRLKSSVNPTPSAPLDDHHVDARQGCGQVRTLLTAQLTSPNLRNTMATQQIFYGGEGFS